MRTDADLTNASRETLLMVIAEQQTTIDELQRRIGDPERRVLPGGRPLGMPGNKPPSRRRQPGRARREVHALESCPECRTD